jgi:hypothetical protein
MLTSQREVRAAYTVIKTVQFIHLFLCLLSISVIRMYVRIVSNIVETLFLINSNIT